MENCKQTMLHPVYMGHLIASINYYIQCLLDVIYGNSEECLLCNNPTEELICESWKKINFTAE